MKKLVLLLAAALFVQACTTLPLPERTISPQNYLSHWQISGRIAVVKGQEGWQGGVDWKNLGGNGLFRIQGPLGRDLFELGYSEDGAWLKSGDRLREAASPSALVLLETGLVVPVEQLRYWIQGFAAPGNPADVERGADGRVEQIRQSGWMIRYSGYGRFGELVRPRRIDVERDDLRIRLVVRDWRDLAPSGRP